MRTTILSVLGQQLDGGTGPDRWERWRPNVDLYRREDLVVDRLDLLYDPRDQKLLDVVVEDVRTLAPETEVATHPVAFADPWDFEEVYGRLHDFARAYPWDTERSEYLVHITTGTHVVQICLFLLTEARHLPGKLLQTSPPKRSTRRGQSLRATGVRVIDLDLSRYDRLAERVRQERLEGSSFLKAGIETRNAAFNRTIERIEHVAIRSAAPILITGPTGAGKSHLARRIYELKRQRRQVTGALVEVNCATLRGDGAMSALFGHRRGAFTGAASDRTGLLRGAHGGALFLDEIGELGVDEQAMLLRAIEDKRFLPVGADREVESDFQLIAGTNRDLREDVRSGRFREDLLARLDLWSFHLPGLAERREDIEPNLDFEVAQYTARTGRAVRLTAPARRRFLHFATSEEARWSASFRDLAAAVTRMATFATSGSITPDLVDDEVARLRERWRGDPAAEPAQDRLADVLSADQRDALDLFDRVQLEVVVGVCGRSRTLAEAGRTLFAASRARRASTNDSDRVRKYLAKFGLNWDDVGDR